MSIIEILSLFVIMVSLAAVPSTSVALVVTRSATSGVGHGVAVSAGIVLGDLVFIALAIFGLSVVAETMGNLFMVIKYMGALYLLWFGLSLLMKNQGARMSVNASRGRSSFIASFLAGFTLTLGDIKAIFFYLSLFPLFVDLTALQTADVLAIAFVAIVSVGGVKVAYALAARKIAVLTKDIRFERAARKTAGGFMVGAGSYIIAKT